MWWSTLSGKLERAAVLDPVVGVATGVVNTVLPRGKVKDGLHGRWLGHPLHPLLVAVPIGMWSGALLLDLTGGPASRVAARRLVGAGVLMVAPSAASGLADWSELGAFDKPKRVGLVHALANVTTTVLFGVSWLARRNEDQERGRMLALAGTAGLVVGGYLGGHLAYSQGVGVNRNADEQKEPTGWTDAAAASDVGEGQLHHVDIDGQAVVLARTGGELFAMGATCSHYGASLAEGELADDGCLVCPWHGSRFRLRDGSVAQGPATAPQLSYLVRTRGERVEVQARP